MEKFNDQQPKLIPTDNVSSRNEGVDLDKKYKVSTNEKDLLITSTQEFVEANKSNLVDAVGSFVKNNKFVLFGEYHIQSFEPVRHELEKSLEQLQKDGLTHVVLEISSDRQEKIDSFDYSDPKVLELLKNSGLIPLTWTDACVRILIKAKQLGLKVILADHPNEGNNRSDLNSGNYQNQRDQHMFNIVNANTDKDSKTLIFIGSDHVHKKSVEKIGNISIKRIGSHLEDVYGGDGGVVSIRSVNENGNFDDLLSFMSKTVTPNDLSVPGKNKQVVILPDDGPIKGDPRVTASDYIVTLI